jgi:hypothetical protein
MAEGGHKDEYTFPESDDDLEWWAECKMNIREVRSHYSSISYYMKIWPGEPDRPKEEMKFLEGYKENLFSDRIKDMLFAKSAERVDSYRPEVAKNSFNAPDDSVEPEETTDGDIGAPEAGEVHPETGVPKVTNTAASVGGEGV